MKCWRCGKSMDVYGAEVSRVKDNKVLAEIPMYAICPKCGYSTLIDVQGRKPSPEVGE